MGFLLAICLPGLITGLAAAKLRYFLWPAVIALTVFEYGLWRNSPSPEGEWFVIFMQMLAFVSASVGLYSGLICTGRQHQDPEV